MPNKQTVEAVDLFCGAGGTSTGLASACDRLGYALNLTAVNHWDVAIETHSANHPNAQHLCESLDNVDPRKLVPSRHLNLLVASPECTHHSVARGGKPVNDQSRASAWHVCRWAEAITVDNILIENVREFRDWGPLRLDGQPYKGRKGETYQAFLNVLRSLGYTVEDRVLNAANYGDPTTRERLFILARRGKKRITWPEPTHAASPETLFGTCERWRAAREIIDWQLPGQSIFNRKKPLSPKTMARIAAGIRKFAGRKAEPFLVMLYGTGTARSVDLPLPTVTANGQHVALCEPFMLGQQSGGAPRSCNEPVPTVATAGAIALCQPFIVGAGGPQGQARPRSVDEPLKTVLTDSRMALCEPFVVSVNHGDDGSTGSASSRCKSVDEPLPVVTTKNGYGLVEPFLAGYYSNGGSQLSSVDEPVPTVTTHDRFALVQPVANGQRLDIRFRMLQPHELAAAQGFPKDYRFTGSREAVVKQIGNAVPVNLATALCYAALGGAQ
jgi:DNA (cytosine-5)-methyltransferase 1